MELISCSAPVLVKESCLEAWIRIGSGGFGQIYKARHKKLCCEVAIKLLHYDDGSGSALLRELELMRQSSCPYVIQVFGVFRGLPPAGQMARLGLVMEFMERGCLATLQGHLGGAPPWPLVFRLAHQVALGINFLHNLDPPLLHLDLKPSNVLLDSYLKAKLTDFGLAKVYHSSRISKRENSSEEGTLAYMPPEAFELSYQPTKSSDIYSYGILLWSIVTGRHPYQHAMSSIVRLRIPLGDRPSLEEIRLQATGIAGLTGLTDLMVQCWGMKSSERPSSYDCTLMTEELFKLHKHAVNCAVLKVLDILDQTPTESLMDQLEKVQITQKSVKEVNNCCYNVKTGKGPVQEVACYMSKEQNRPKDQSVTYPVCVSDEKLSCSKLKSSSVKPIGASMPLPLPLVSSSSSCSSSTSSSKHRVPEETLLPNRFSQYQRQYSSPDTLPAQQPQHPLPHINIHCSNVTGLQCGNNNVMHIQGLIHSERRRHPTAPSRVNLPPQRRGSGKDKKGGVG
ncbi:hypothetical protein NL108_017057 [Boleophthalmus pectinirostris]|uniref:receptor-interacting serine/threonine-protein kinase 3 n=1 Tax=Boleophthalmus pectinirostris TaxID=150288 RepID=UPI000A1C23B7|nr:receptor-interacting serine/threonine-protein kinase 3 [Boleophthalmus pectinirostris]KAJ0055974.1 hypothetical protein NL108_017057 [Boleophthalmus pectinirostris]